MSHVLQVAVFACTTPNTLRQGLLSLFISSDSGLSWIPADGRLSVYTPNTSASLAPYNGFAPWPSSMLAAMSESGAEGSGLPCILSAVYRSNSSATSVALKLDTVSPSFLLYSQITKKPRCYNPIHILDDHVPCHRRTLPWGRV